MGVGSVLRNDDGAGMYFIEKLENAVHPADTASRRENILCIAGSSAPENFTGVIKDFAPDRLFIVDAAAMGLPVGEIGVIDASEIKGMSFSTHMLPLSVMLAYIEMEAGCEVICIGIQPENTQQGLTICDEVQRGADLLVKMFCDVL